MNILEVGSDAETYVILTEENIGSIVLEESTYP